MTTRMLDGKTDDIILLLGRLALGAIFVISGFGKVFNVGAFASSLARSGVPAADVLAVIGVIVEFGGGLLVVTGFKIRPAALLMIVFTIVATAISHRFWALTDVAARRSNEVHFLKNVAIVGGFVLLYVTGAGRYSLEALLQRQKG